MRYTQSVGFGVEASEVVMFLWTPVLGEAERTFCLLDQGLWSRDWALVWLGIGN